MVPLTERRRVLLLPMLGQQPAVLPFWPQEPWLDRQQLLMFKGPRAEPDCVGVVGPMKADGLTAGMGTSAVEAGPLETIGAIFARTVAKDVLSMLVFIRGLLIMEMFIHVAFSKPLLSSVMFARLLPSSVVLLSVVFSSPVCAMVRLR